MSGLTNPDTVAVMLAGPATAVVRHNFNYQIGPNFTTDCRLHYTPTEPPADPRSPPAEPVAPAPLGHRARGRPTYVRRQAEIDFQAATEAYNNAVANHPAVLAAHAAQLAAYEAHIAKAEDSDVDSDDGLAAHPDPDLIFTHGRGSTLDAPAIVAFTEGFARSQCMLSFHDMRSHNERATTFRSLQNNFPSTTAIGGRSMGAQACARAQLYGPAKKVIFMSYPLVNGLSVREEELLAIETDVDVLFIIGDEDPKAQELHFRAIRSRMRCRTWWIKVTRGDHAMLFSPQFPQKRIDMCNAMGQLAALWNVQRDPKLTQLNLDWEGTAADGHPVWTEWMAQASEPPKGDTRFNVSVLGPHLPGGGGSFTFALPQ